MNLTKRYRPVLLMLIALVLAGCSTFLGPRTVNLSLPELQSALANQLPIDSRYLGLFDVRLNNPKLSLQEGRLDIALDAAVRPILAEQGWNGSFSLSGVPRVDVARRALVLGQIRVDRLHVDGLSSAYGSQLGRLGTALAELFITDLPIYTFRDDDFRFAGTRFVPTNISTAANGLVITFEPAR